MEVEMKMVKTLLLGTAAGFVAVAGAQAADMPVKGAAVQYVKICNLYGDGFYYLPGTNICVKIGGYVRAQDTWGTGSSNTNGPFQAGSATGSTATAVGFSDRLDGNDLNYRARAYISMDTREQTDYGILRSYINIGLNFDSGQTNVFSGNRAFIQFAGFTLGLAQSFFDFYSVPISQYNGYTPASDTGDGGYKVAAFTVLYGNGITSTVSLEEPRRTSIVSTNTIAAQGGANGVFAIFGGSIDCSLFATASCNDYAKGRFPDLVTNWRIDQAWGSAQIMFAAHDASAAYYMPGFGSGPGINNPIVVPAIGCGPAAVGTSPTGAEVCGHPADKVGWAAGIGSKHNFVGLGDYFQWQATYSKGALKYVDNTQNGNPYGYFTGNTLGWGVLVDGIVNNVTGGVDLTTVWGLNAAYDHLWTPQFRTSIYASYMAVQYDQVANLSICANQNSQNTTAGGISAIANCSNNWSVWFVGSRTQYNFTPAFYVGFDATYGQLVTADQGVAVYTQLGGTAKPTGVYSITNQSTVGFQVRLHRDILP
jgi:hypothetical protein